MYGMGGGALSDTSVLAELADDGVGRAEQSRESSVPETCEFIFLAYV